MSSRRKNVRAKIMSVEPSRQPFLCARARVIAVYARSPVHLAPLHTFLACLWSSLSNPSGVA